MKIYNTILLFFTVASAKPVEDKFYDFADWLTSFPPEASFPGALCKGGHTKFIKFPAKTDTFELVRADFKNGYAKFMYDTTKWFAKPKRILFTFTDVEVECSGNALDDGRFLKYTRHFDYVKAVERTYNMLGSKYLTIPELRHKKWEIVGTRTEGFEWQKANLYEH